jgi:hypothetical protein
MPELDFYFSKHFTAIVPEKIINLVKLYSKNDDHIKKLYHENFVYGHQEILLQFCNLELSTQIIGVIQHGLSLDVNFDTRSPRFLGNYKTKYWAWSRETQVFAEANGKTNVRAIGAPWLYLREATKTSNINPTSETKILIMPGHSVAHTPDIENYEFKLKRARLFRDAIGGFEATVCLHAVDFCDWDTRRAFVSYDFKVECVGSSLLDPPWSTSSNRVRTLKTLMDLMQDHSHYVSDSFGTSLFYAINLGLKVAIFPEIYQATKTDLESATGVGPQWIKGLGYLQNLMPRVINGFSEAKDYVDLVNQKLGKDSMLESAELKELLDYRKNVYELPKNDRPW